jgi:hypothetical protein
MVLGSREWGKHLKYCILGKNYEHPHHHYIICSK